MPQPIPASPETTPQWATGVRRRIPFYLLASLLLALLAAVVTFIYLEQARAAMVPSAPALVARSGIRPGETITEAMVEVRAVPEGVVPADRLVDVAQAVGRVALVPLAENEIILPQRLSGGGPGGLAGHLPDGRWGMVLPDGWLATPIPGLIAGDRIDILAYQPGQPIAEAVVIAAGLEVLVAQDGKDHAGGLVVAVTIDEAAALAYARANGFLLLPLLRPTGG